MLESESYFTENIFIRKILPKLSKKCVMQIYCETKENIWCVHLSA